MRKPCGTLLKGIEEESYTGTADGHIVGLSPQLAAMCNIFRSEPDARNVEYSVDPFRDYADVECQLIERRHILAKALRQFGPYQIIPGGSLALGDTSVFYPSKSGEPYWDHIEKAYHTNVVTAGMHINIGIDNMPLLFAAYRTIRCEAALFLTLSAGSPFLDGRATGYRSTRWHIFPKTPATLPLFTDQKHYCRWMENAIATGRLFNHRHVWNSVRPNGPLSPKDLDRLELRICDRVDDPPLLIAITALLESRVLQLRDGDAPTMPPPCDSSPLDKAADTDADLIGQYERELLDRIDHNEEAAARDGFDAICWRWDVDAEVPLRQWLREYIDEAKRCAARYGFAEMLEPLEDVLENGTPADRWLRAVADGESIESVVRRAIIETSLKITDERIDLPHECPMCPTGCRLHTPDEKRE